MRKSRQNNLRILIPKGNLLAKTMGDFKDTCTYYLINPLVNLFYNIIYGVLNLWKWMPVVWRDRDWDWFFLSEVVRFKLKNMADSMEESNRHVGSSRDVRDMRICVELLRKLSEDKMPTKKSIKRAGFSHKFYLLRRGPRLSGIQKELGRILGRKLTNWWV